MRATVTFQVTTGQDYRGEETYRHMAAQRPDFLVSTGDNVYYDGPPKARDVQGAYDAYQMMYGLPLMKQYFEHVGGYFEKDDHDYRFNDADRWQQRKGGDGGRRKNNKKSAPEKWLTHDEGIMVFKQVFPMSDPTYRTFRWGKGVQIWLVEGRDFRSPNAMPDGPDKTLWGQEQLKWLKRTLLESDADWRVLISPTPIIGPDRVTKNDNHADPKGFWTRGPGTTGLDQRQQTRQPETDLRRPALAVRIARPAQWSRHFRIQLRADLRSAHGGGPAYHRCSPRGHAALRRLARRFSERDVSARSLAYVQVLRPRWQATLSASVLESQSVTCAHFLPLV